MKFKAPRGTRDVLPPETIMLEHVRNTAVRVLKNYRYTEISTPIFEQTELFARGIGQLTDIVEKEMYTFQDKKGRSLTLRPEGTASIVRAYLENNLGRSGLQKLFYQGPMFRYERPQAGRYRQFEQIGVEVIGSQSPIVDAEVIAIGVKICEELGIKGINVAVNSVGCTVCRPVVREQLKSFIKSSLRHLCDDCKRRYETNPLRILDCKNERCKTYFTGLPSSISVLCHECADHFSSVLEYLETAKVGHEISPFLVRGLDYYTKTAFEICSDKLGAQNSICGGGRYDELIKELGGPKTPAFGFAFGVERMLMVLEQQEVMPDFESSRPFVYFITMREVARRKAFVFRNKLCDLNIRSEIDLEDRSFKSQFKRANDLKAVYVCIIGEEELEKG
ncbi:histidine--tRNA ligase, partial [Candidatus Margulisiibacteriota bacterium]